LYRAAEVTERVGRQLGLTSVGKAFGTMRASFSLLSFLRALDHCFCMPASKAAPTSRRAAAACSFGSRAVFDGDFIFSKWCKGKPLFRVLIE